MLPATLAVLKVTDTPGVTNVPVVDISGFGVGNICTVKVFETTADVAGQA